jgi:hypothetical protein
LVVGIASATEPATKPAETAATAPAPEQAKITKSRSNIQNNREATPPATTSTDSKPAPEVQGVVKTKTKSNQSND